MSSLRPCESTVPEDTSRLAIFDTRSCAVDTELILQMLKRDMVVLLQYVSPDQADRIIHNIASRLDLSNSLTTQAGFAAIMGHRQGVGKYFMTVNERDRYHFITPHSEGNSFHDMQLASFYCFENSTDGGETILMNVDDESECWPRLREMASRAKIGLRSLSRSEIVRARALYGLNLPADVVAVDDEVLRERATQISGLKLFDVLTRTKKQFSRILGRNLNVYWDSVAGTDFDDADEFARMLREARLLKEPPVGLDISALDNAFARRRRRSGLRYAQLFRCKVTHKLAACELIIQNNLTWTHGVTNWSPDRGSRRVVAAFA
jgi:hypothetical protein